jgi:hypothetical protein
MPTIRESGQARPSGVAHCPGGAGPRRLAAAVGKPADSMENVIQNHGDVVNRSGWTDGRSTPYPVRRIGHPRTRRYIRLLDGRAVIDRNPRPLSGPFGFVSCLDGVRELDQAALLGPCSRRVGARRDHTTHSLVRAVRSNWSATRSVAICIDYSVLVGVNMAFPGALAPVWAKHHPFRVAHGQS